MSVAAPPAGAQGSAASARRVVLWSAALALAVRLLAFAQEAATPFLGVPILDEAWYDGAARALLGWPGGIVLDGFRPLLHPAFLALIYGAAGQTWGPAAAIAAQHLLGVGTGILVALLARRAVGSDVAGLAAGALWALAAPPVFLEGQLLSETLFGFLLAAALVLASGRPALGRAAAAGALVGLAGQVRPNALLLAAAFPLLAWLEARSGAPRPALRRAAAALGALAAVHLAAMALQAPVNGGFRLLPGSGGVNLYLGNRRGADGMIPRQGAPVAAGVVYRDSVQAWSEEEYARAHPDALQPRAADLDRYWLARTAQEIRACPPCWLRLVGRKKALLLWNEEIANHRSFRFAAREDLPLLAWLPVRWWTLLALAPLGAVWLRRRDRGRALAWCLAFVALLAIGVIAFFVNDRYRLPLWPPLVVLSGAGVEALRQWAAARDWRQLAAALGAAGVGALLALVNWTSAALPPPSRDYFYRSLARLERGEGEGARRDAERSVELDPADAPAQLQLGNAALALGDLEAAIAAYRRALGLDAAQPVTWNNLGAALERAGDRAGALAAYRRAAALDPAYPLDRGALKRLEASIR